MRIHCFQNEEVEDCGSIKTWTDMHEHKITYTKFYRDELFDDYDHIDLLVVLGGSMNIYEEKKYPWLKKEKLSIEKALKKQKKILGICLGSQLLADVLGAPTIRNEYKEIGWHKVYFTNKALDLPLFHDFPNSVLSLHWHEDTFKLPDGAILIGSSDACPNQGFVYEKNAVGFQFHMEFTPELLKNILHQSDELVKDTYVQSHAELHCVSLQQYERNNFLLEKFLDRFTSY